jgi:hypothetical protein
MLARLPSIPWLRSLLRRLEPPDDERQLHAPVCRGPRESPRGRRSGRNSNRRLLSPRNEFRVSDAAARVASTRDSLAW